MTASKLNLDALREEIDRIDAEMTKLYEARMNAAKNVAVYKQEKGLPIFVPEREKAVIDKNIKNINHPEYREMYREFITFVMAQSKTLQRDILKNI